MGRHFEVRAASMAKTSAKKSSLYMRASKEIYVAAKSGLPDPNSNLALRSVIDKYKSLSVPKDVIDRAIKKAAGGSTEAYTSGRYEAFGPGGSFLVIDSLTDNTNRAFIEIRSAVSKKNGHLGNVLFNFTEVGLLIFAYQDVGQIEETLVLGNIDVYELTSEDGIIEVQTNPRDLNAAKQLLSDLKIEEFEMCEITLLANEVIELNSEDLGIFKQLLEVLDNLEDVQNVYHNVKQSLLAE